MKFDPSGMLARSLNLSRALAALGIEAKSVGDQLQAHCPRTRAHPGGDRRPSWSIRDDFSDKRGIHGCWSCGYTGTILTLTREVLRITPDDGGWKKVEAWLVEHAGSDAPPPTIERVEIDVLSEALPLTIGSGVAIPTGVTIAPMSSWPSPPRRYLEVDRGISEADVLLWGLGWAMLGRCAGRIFIPITAANGKLAGYTGRAYDGRHPKYLAAHQSEGPDSTVLFGEHLWPAHSVRDTVFITEGELNAIAAHRYLRGEVAATGGVEKLLEEHLLKLSTFPRRIVIQDGDDAGRLFSAKVKQGLAGSVLVAKLPEGHDALSISPKVLKDACERAS